MEEVFIEDHKKESANNKALGEMRNFALLMESRIVFAEKELFKRYPEAHKITKSTWDELKKISTQLGNERKLVMYIIGLTGSGKSSLVCALMGRYLNIVEKVKAKGTVELKEHILEEANIRAFDTQGWQVGNTRNAKSLILKKMKEYPPDIVLVCVSCDRYEDTEQAKCLNQVLKAINPYNCPIIFNCTHLDQS